MQRDAGGRHRAGAGAAAGLRPRARLLLRRLQYGEASDDVQTFVSKAAAKGATEHWVRMGARSAQEARGVIKAQLTCQIGVTIARENAWMKLKRLGLLAGGYQPGGDKRRNNRAFGNRARRAWWALKSGFAQMGGGGSHFHHNHAHIP